jgi:hypothetical protein
MKDFELLGLKVKDRITGNVGVVTSISYDLYGCIQALVTPGQMGKEGEYPKQHWFDTSRLAVLSAEPVMNVPSFNGEKGGNELPGFTGQPS